MTGAANEAVEPGPASAPPRTSPPAPGSGRLARLLVLVAFGAIPAVLANLFLAEEPRERGIHVEAFRYGKDPSVIRANRGDRLRLTFSTRDTGHSFFLEEFDMDVKISPGAPDVEVFRTSDPEAPSVRAREVILVAEPPGLFPWLRSKFQYRCHVWCGPMHAFEHGTLIVGPNTLLAAGLGLLLGIPVVGLLGLRGALRKGRVEPPRSRPTDGVDVFRRFPFLKRIAKLRELQPALILLASALFYAVLLTAFFGTHMSGRNLGVVLLWIVWLFLLTAILTPLGGRIWCLACPLPALGDILQRRSLRRVRETSPGSRKEGAGDAAHGAARRYNNRFFGRGLRWPSWLSSSWPRTIVYLSMGTFSTVLVASPRATAWAILGLFLLATGMALVWELRAFCRYLCPVSAFVGLYGSMGKLALRAADPDVCARCKVHTCLRGSAKGWACPFGLSVAEIDENTDCGLCTECVKTCAYDNVTLWWRPFASETRVRTMSEAFLAITMLALAAAYSVLHLGHWPALRDAVNILDKANWGLFGVFAAILWSVCLAVLPGLLFLASAAGKRLAAGRAFEGGQARGSRRALAPTERLEATGPAGGGPAEAAPEEAPWRTAAVFRASAGALIPIGLALWIAFVVPMLFTNLTFVLQSLSDPFGWGWDFFGTRSSPWHQLLPGAVPWIQVACVLVGLSYSLRNAWRIWLGITPYSRAALRGMLPVSLFLVVVAGAFVVFFAD